MLKLHDVILRYCLYTQRLCIIRRIAVLHLADRFGSRSLGQTFPVHTTSQWHPVSRRSVTVDAGTHYVVTVTPELSQWHPSSSHTVTVDVTCDVQRLLDLVERNPVEPTIIPPPPPPPSSASPLPQTETTPPPPHFIMILVWANSSLLSLVGYSALSAGYWFPWWDKLTTMAI